MVAIHLYKGNLHKVPDVPRVWLMPTPTISAKNFKILLRRRNRALSRLSTAATTTTITTTNPDCPNNSATNKENGYEQNGKVDCGENKADGPKLEKQKGEEEEQGKTENGKKELVNGNCSKELVEASDGLAAVVVENGVKDAAEEPKEAEDEEKAEGVNVINPSSEIDKKEDAVNNEKRREEIEEKLRMLNQRKHSLVQFLKQILNAEEELKKRNSILGSASRPSISLQVDTTHDSGSISRLNTPRMGSDGNVSGGVEGGQTDDINHNVHSRQLLCSNSISPSSDSQQRKSAFNAVTLPSRTNSGAANSPSRFAVTGQQGNPSNLPSVSASGTNYVASSPSPAASGGTSAFRDGRTSSPWN